MGRIGSTGRQMRQYFLIARAFELMVAFEHNVDRRFDAVLRTRTDMMMNPPIHPANFPELGKRVVYNIFDIAFFSNRNVARDLLQNVDGRMLSLVGRDRALMPIQYMQILDSDLQDTEFYLLNYPCIPAAQPQFSLQLSRSTWLAPGKRVSSRV